MVGVPPEPLSDEQLLKRLVAFDSTSSRSNAPIADFICEYLDVPGVEVVRMVQSSGEKVNVVAIAGPREDASRRGLVLSGHMDVVPATEPKWTSDPFELVQRDGAYYGRGTCDMKGFVALAMNTLREAAAAKLTHLLVLILTYDEELGSLGAKRLVETWPENRPLPRSAVIGEPTSLGVVRMHKGHLKVRLTLRGKAAHSGSPHLGTNAIEPAWELLCGLAELRKHLESKRSTTSSFFPQAPFTVLTVARIRGGEAVNVIPETCEIDVGVRLLPGESAEAVVVMIEGIARTIEGEVRIEVEAMGENPPMLTEESAEIHRVLCEMTGQSESRGVSYASDAGWLSRMGMECVLFGPGTIEVAHRPNECLPIDEFVRAREMLRELVRRCCSEG